MCRLYTLRSNQRRKVGCELIAAQNSLLRQSQGDATGEAHGDGWGLGHYQAGQPEVVVQPVAAASSESFRWEAALVLSTNIVAHVRKATVGRPDDANTHPFRYQRWLLAHNGTVRNFGFLRDRILAGMTPDFRNLARGSTDSEHVFHLILSRATADPGTPLLDVVRRTTLDLVTWSNQVDRSAELALNLIVTNGAETVVQRFGRTLWTIERHAVHPCQICNGAIHVEGVPRPDYRSVVFASEPVTTDEVWTTVPDGTLARIGPDIEVQRASL
ncbi:MAG: class II glutamine amidotransferase [Gemmatimonadales bacterium]